MNAPLPPTIPTLALVEELHAHLGAAVMQLLPSDDAIIAEHLRSAHALAKVLYRGVRA